MTTTTTTTQRRPPAARLRRIEPAAIGAVVFREATLFRRYWRSTTFSSVVEPTIYLLAFGFGFGSLVAQVSSQRALLITIDDADAATRVFELLMGSEVAPRKEFIVQGAYEVDAATLDA